MKKRKFKNKIKPKKNYILRIAAAAFFIVILATIVDQQIKIQQSRAELEDVTDELELAQMKTLDLEKKSQLAEQAGELTVSEVSSPGEESSGESSENSDESTVTGSGEETSGESNEESSEEASKSSENSEESTESKTEEQEECEEYLRQEALRLGYAKSGVRVFQNIAGN